MKPGGLLLNFDANWYNYLYDADLKQQYEQDRRNVQQNDLEDHYLSTDIDAMEAIALQVPLTGIQRPHWGISALWKSCVCVPLLLTFLSGSASGRR